MSAGTDDDRRFMAHEKQFADNTHGTSQRRGARGDPWRRELRDPYPNINEYGNTPVPTRPDPGRVTSGPAFDLFLGDWTPFLVLAAAVIGFLVGWFIG